MGRTKQQDDSDSEQGAMEVEAQHKPKVRKLNKKIAKPSKRQSKMDVQADTTLNTTSHSQATRVDRKTESLQKKLRVFKQMKQTASNPLLLLKESHKKGLKGTPKLSKGQKERIQKKKKILFKKLLEQKLTEKKASMSMQDLQTELNRIKAEQQTSKPQKHKSMSLIAKTKLQTEEASRMRQILDYPEFQKNPLKALKTHLVNQINQKSRS